MTLLMATVRATPVEPARLIIKFFLGEWLIFSIYVETHNLNCSNQEKFLWGKFIWERKDRSQTEIVHTRNGKFYKESHILILTWWKTKMGHKFIDVNINKKLATAS